MVYTCAEKPLYPENPIASFYPTDFLAYPTDFLAYPTDFLMI